MNRMVIEAKPGAFRLKVHEEMSGFHRALCRLDLSAAREYLARLLVLSTAACDDDETCFSEYSLHSCNAMLADTLALLGEFVEAAIVADRTWLGLQDAATRRVQAGLAPRGNSMVKAILLMAIAQVAWQQETGTLSKVLDARGLCEQYLGIRKHIAESLADRSRASELQRNNCAATLVTAGVAVAKAAYRHCRRLLPQVIGVLNKEDQASLMLAGGHFRMKQHVDSPRYFDFEIAKGLVDGDLSSAEFDWLDARRAALWPLYGADQIPASLKIQWRREGLATVPSSYSGVPPVDHSQQEAVLEYQGRG